MTRLIACLILTFGSISMNVAFSQKKDAGDDVSNASRPKSEVIKAKSMLDDDTFIIDDFAKGYVLLPNNTIKGGLLRFNGRVAIFKDSVTEKTTRYGAKELKGFTVQADTFKVCLDTVPIAPNPRTPLAPKFYVDDYFIKQMIHGDKVCLFKRLDIKQAAGSMMMTGGGAFMMTGGTGMYNNVFYLKRKTELKYTEIPTGKKSFKKLMSDYFKDDDKIRSAITNNLLTYKNLDEIVNNYNQNKVSN